MGEKLCLGETCISEPELQQSSTCDRNQQPPAPTYHRIAFSRLRHCVASRPAPAHARFRWNKVIEVRSRHMPPVYKDPGLILLAATVAAATFFAVYVAF
jgi:hypothetical protein